MDHEFTTQILAILGIAFGEKARAIFDISPILQYLNIKTRSASRNSKSRGSFGNLYAIYVLVEDYLSHQFDMRGDYSSYEGARFSDLFNRQRQLPFGSKLQNHALNHRMNEEFHKYFPEVEFIPILRDIQNGRYWINENLLLIPDGEKTINLAPSVKQIIETYINTKQAMFVDFIKNCERLSTNSYRDDDQDIKFIAGLLAPTQDARIFEIVSYSILRYYYHDQIIYFGFDLENLKTENLRLYKTGRTNANDGGIDFVMRPLGRFFQVTETLDIKKYFLDIDKVERFPISFVVKSMEDTEVIHNHIREGAKRLYAIDAIVEKYMACIEEIINIPKLLEYFHIAHEKGFLAGILDEIVLQSKVEFNFLDLTDIQ
ncbi:MAG: restriction endonuclease [Chloroflexota bacterium]